MIDWKVPWNWMEVTERAQWTLENIPWEIMIVDFYLLNMDVFKSLLHTSQNLILHCKLELLVLPIHRWFTPPYFKIIYVLTWKSVTFFSNYHKFCDECNTKYDSNWTTSIRSVFSPCSWTEAGWLKFTRISFSDLIMNTKRVVNIRSFILGYLVHTIVTFIFRTIELAVTLYFFFFFFKPVMAEDFRRH